MLENEYANRRYLTPQRWSGYWHQIDEVMDSGARDVLEIGPGNKIVSDVLKKIGFNVKTLDFDPEIKPDYLKDLTKLDPKDIPEFDLILACEIFEHIPYEDFLNSLKKMLEVSNKYLVISLPYVLKGSFIFSLGAMIYPIFRWKKFIKKFIVSPTKWEYNGKHYWELGTKQTPLRKVLKDIKLAGWKIKKGYIVKEDPYRYFIICEKNG